MSSDEPQAGPSSSSASSSSSSSGSDFKSRMSARMSKLQSLHSKRTESRTLNHREVVNEDKRNKEPKNMEARKRRAEYLLKEEELRAECEAQGKDFDRERLRHVGADEAEASDRRKRRARENADGGFSTYEEATARKYNKLVKGIRPDMERYERAKATQGEAFYADGGTLVHGVHKDTGEAIERMAEDVRKQVEKREKYSRRRMFDADADVDYINERNMNFNKKLERFYGEYTKDIRDNLERGTAV